MKKSAAFINILQAPGQSGTPDPKRVVVGKMRNPGQGDRRSGKKAIRIPG
jgi:hypothetical protein